MEHFGSVASSETRFRNLLFLCTIHEVSCEGGFENNLQFLFRQDENPDQFPRVACRELWIFARLSASTFEFCHLGDGLGDCDATFLGAV